MLVLKRSLLAVFFLLSTSFVMNQLAAQQTMILDPVSLFNLPAERSVHMVGVTYTGGADAYTVVLAPSWVTVSSTATDGNISMTITENTGAARSDRVFFTPTGGSGTATGASFIISQVGAGQRVTPTPISLTDVSAAGSTEMVSLTLAGGATGYTVEGAPTWAPVPATTTDGSISIVVEANPGGPRSATVTLTPTGGSAIVIPTIFILSQLANSTARTVILNPGNLFVGAAAFTQSVAVTYGRDATGYSVAGAPSWVTVPAMATEGNISVMIEANTGAARSTTITFTATGGTMGTAGTTPFTIRQASGAADAPRSVTPTPPALLGVPAAGADYTVPITLGGGATGFSSVGGIPDWVSYRARAGIADITVRANTRAARVGSLTFAPTGGSGTAVNTVFVVSQLSGIADRVITLNPTALFRVAAAGETRMVGVTLGGDATGYSVTGAPAWVTVPAMPTDGNISIRIEANTGAARRASISFTATGGTMGVARTTVFAIDQLAPTPQTVDLTPTSLSGIAATGSTEMVMVALGGDATGYSVPASGTGSVPSWVTGIAATGMAGALSVVVMPNTGAARMATIVFTPTGGSVGIVTPTNFVISQAAPPRTVTLAPTGLTDVVAAGSTTMVALTLGGDATGYSVPASGMGAPPSWVTGIAATGMAGTLSIMVAENTGVARMATIVFTPTGGSVGTVVPTNFVINQLAAPQTIMLVPDALTGVAAAGSTTPVMITYGGDADAYTLSGVPDWATVPATATAGSISIMVNENTGVARNATVVFTPTGGTGTATPTNFMISQLAAGAAAQTITFDPTEFPSVASAEGTIEVGVMFGGGATGFTVPALGMPGAAPAWVTVPPMVDAMNDLELSILANSATSSRMAMITFTPTGGSGTATPTTLNITQQGSLPSGPHVILTPNMLIDVPATETMRTVMFMLGGGATGLSLPMTGEEGALPDWVTITSMTTTEVVLTIGANASPDSRRAEITVTTTGGAGTRTSSTLLITQIGAVVSVPTVTLSRTAVASTTGTGGSSQMSVNIYGGATSWTSSTPEGVDWVTVNPAMGMPMEGTNSTSVSVTLSRNETAMARMTTVTFTPLGGSGMPVPATLMVSQGAASQRLVITPVSFDEVSAAGTTLELMVDLERGATGFTATTTDDWITLPEATGDGEGPFMIMVDANTTMDERDGEVRFFPTGGEGGVAVNLPINQSAPATIPTIMLDPSTIDAMAAGGDETVEVLFSGGATAYSVPTSGVGAPQSWVTVPASSTIDADDEITVALLANPSRRPRYDTVYFMPTTGMGREGDDTLYISQAGAVPTGGQSVTLLPTTFEEVLSVGVTIEVEVSFGGGATGYSVPTTGIGAPASWVTVPASSTIDEDGLIEVTIAENMGAMERKDTVYFAPTGGSGTALEDTLYITQLGTVVAGPSLTLSPDELADVSAAGIMRKVKVTFVGGAEGFTVPAMGTGSAPDWVMVPTMVDAMDSIQITIMANTASSSRTAIITFMPTGGDGTRTDATLTITQLGTAPAAQTIVLDPTSFDDVPAAGGMRTAGVTLGGGATGFSVPTTGEGAAPSWVTVPAMADAMNNLEITIRANTTTSARSAMITFTPTGGTGTATPATLTINQLGAALGISVTSMPTNLTMLAAAGGTVTATIAISGGATGWRVILPSPAFTTSSAASGTGDGTATLTYARNTTTSAREDTVMFVTVGGTGTAARDTLVLKQLARSAPPAMNFGSPEGVFADIRVVNPTYDELVVYGLSESVHLRLRDLSGRQVFSAALAVGEQRVPLPALSRGVYILSLTNKEGEVANLRLLRK